MKEVGLLVIHGIGTTREDFDKRFKKSFTKRLERLDKDPDKIAYEKVFWSEYINERQSIYFDSIRKIPGQKMYWNLLRKFVLHNFGDAGAYQNKQGQNNENYYKIIRAINAAVRSIRTKLASDDKPLIIFAHSLGGFVISNYIWDAHRRYAGEHVDWPNDVTLNGKFEHMINLSGMVTYGCNIPLFALGHDPIEAIKFPHPQLGSELQTKSKWFNFYDPDDVLGWPLRPLKYSFDGKPQPADARSYSDVVDKDIVANVGKLLSWSPLSHIMYWTDGRFIKPAAKFVAEFL